MSSIVLYKISENDIMKTYKFHIILTPPFCKSVSKALIGDPALRVQSVCCIAFDQAVHKIECFDLDETIQKRFCFSQRGKCLGGALHHPYSHFLRLMD